MRSPDFQVDHAHAAECPRDISLRMFTRMAEVRAFERQVIAAVKRKAITTNVYLSTGQEALAAALSVSEARNHLVFAQHRAHDLFLAFGGDPARLRDELLGRASGTSGGRAGSNCLQWHEGGTRMFGHHGLIGENVSLAVGAALGAQKPTLCVLGDGAVEEDYVLSSLGFAATRRLPVLFVCVDNDLSILTRTVDRRSWSAVDVAKAFGMAAFDMADDPWSLRLQLGKLTNPMPAFLNVRVCRAHWHVGTGVDGPPEWDRYALVRDTLRDLGAKAELAEIEQETERRMEELWAS